MDTKSTPPQYIHAELHKGEWTPYEIVDDLDNYYSNLEYGDVKEARYQLWEYPSGILYQVTTDDEVDDKNYYSPPSKGEGGWSVKLVALDTNKERVEQAFQKLSK